MVHLNINDMPVNAMAVVQICNSVSRILTQQPNNARNKFTAKWEWQICSTHSVTMRFRTDAKDSPVYLKVVQFWVLHAFDFEMRT